MTQFKASHELADILLRNCFKETTKQIYPKHFEFIKNNGYNPDLSKRIFSLGTNNIKFDYINIIPSYNGGCHGNEIASQIGELPLKGIIAFYKCSSRTRNFLYLRYREITKIYSHYKTINEYPEWHKLKSDKEFRVQFESIKIN